MNRAEIIAEAESVGLPNPYQKTVADAVAEAKRHGGTTIQTAAGFRPLDQWATGCPEPEKGETFFRLAHQSPKVNHDGRLGEIVMGYGMNLAASLFPVFKTPPTKENE